MKHSKDNPKEDGSPSRRRFYQLLDRLAGIEGWEKVSDEQFVREAREAEPVPVTPEQVEEAVARWRAFQAAAATPIPRRPWWRRRVAVIAMLALVLLGAATPIYLVWSGRNSTRELAYEDALSVVFDDTYQMASREAAQVRVMTSILRGITAINNCSRGRGALGDEARTVANTLRRMVAKPRPLKGGSIRAPGDYERLLSTLSDPDGIPADRSKALRKTEEAIHAGLDVLNRALVLGPPFDRNSQLAFAHIARRLDQAK